MFFLWEPVIKHLSATTAHYSLPTKKFLIDVTHTHTQRKVESQSWHSLVTAPSEMYSYFLLNEVTWRLRNSNLLPRTKNILDLVFPLTMCVHLTWERERNDQGLHSNEQPTLTQNVHFHFRVMLTNYPPDSSPFPFFFIFTITEWRSLQCNIWQCPAPSEVYVSVFRQEALIIPGSWSHSTGLHEPTDLIQANHCEFIVSAFAVFVFVLHHFRHQQNHFSATLSL